MKETHKMKKIIVLLALSACVAQARVIDLTPGGYNPDGPLPPAFYQLIRQTFFDDAAHGWFDTPEGRQYINGWVSLYGTLNGGTYFFTNIFSLPGNTPSALMWWDFTGEPDGYYLTGILVEGFQADGQTPWANIYAVQGMERMQSLGEHLITLNGMASISDISFYGRNR